MILVCSLWYRFMIDRSGNFLRLSGRPCTRTGHGRDGSVEKGYLSELSGEREARPGTASKGLRLGGLRVSIGISHHSNPNEL
jgi:hypothetical protein